MDSIALSIPFTTLAIDPVTYAVPTKRVRKRKREEALVPFVHTNLAHCHGRLDPTCHSINTRRETEKIQGLVFLTNGIRRIDPSPFHISSLNGLHNTFKKRAG
jgi:hypothetical protein